VLDPVLNAALARRPKTALDVGWGEGQLCWMLKHHDIERSTMRWNWTLLNLELPARK